MQQSQPARRTALRRRARLHSGGGLPNRAGRVEILLDQEELLVLGEVDLIGRCAAAVIHQLRPLKATRAVECVDEQGRQLSGTQYTPHFIGRAAEDLAVERAPVRPQEGGEHRTIEPVIRPHGRGHEKHASVRKVARHTYAVQAWPRSYADSRVAPKPRGTPTRTARAALGTRGSRYAQPMLPQRSARSPTTTPPARRRGGSSTRVGAARAPHTTEARGRHRRAHACRCSFRRTPPPQLPQ